MLIGLLKVELEDSYLTKNSSFPLDVDTILFSETRNVNRIRQSLVYSFEKRLEWLAKELFNLKMASTPNDTLLK